MTQSEAENMAQLNQIQSLKEARDRVTEVLLMMSPLVERMAVEGDPLARYLVDELNKAQDNLKLVNMNGHFFLEERTETPS